MTEIFLVMITVMQLFSFILSVVTIVVIVTVFSPDSEKEKDID